MGLARILLRLILVRRWPIDTLARNDIDEHAVLHSPKRARPIKSLTLLALSGEMSSPGLT